MRLTKYITENRISDYYDLVEKDCKKYLKTVENSDYFLIRWADKQPITYKKKVRKNRVPLDTPLKVHKFIDRSFKKKFGWKPRSEGLFCFASDEWSAAFLVFPIGNFKFVWSNKVDDLTVSLAKIINAGPIQFKRKFEKETVTLQDGSEIPSEEHMDLIKDYWNKNLLKTYKSTNFKKALEMGKASYEISVKCDEAYLIKDSVMAAKKRLFGKEFI